MLITAQKFYANERPPRMEAATFVDLGALLEIEVAAYGVSGWTLGQFAERDPLGLMQAVFSDFHYGRVADQMIGYTPESRGQSEGVVDSTRMGLFEAELAVDDVRIDPSTMAVDFGLYQLPENYEPVVQSPYEVIDRLRHISNWVVGFSLVPNV